MTISILAYDERTGSYGGAATTGSLCVGGWVLRGHAESGLSASQGSLPSTIWGDAVLALMKSGHSAEVAVESVTSTDGGREQRQLAAMDLYGRTGSFTGSQSIPEAGALAARHVVVCGNLLTSEVVLDRCLDAFTTSKEPLDLRLLAALDAASAAGGDSRGLLSAALLIVSRRTAPITLRIDRADDPLVDLRALHKAATTGEYAQWVAHVPTLENPKGEAPPGLESSGSNVHLGTSTRQ